MKSETYTIKNEYIAVEISDFGAEMQSIKNSKGVEYLWQGDPKYWSDRAINLFPYVGRMTDGQYSLNGRTYNMSIHGFAQSSRMTAKKVEQQWLTFSLKDNPETREVYPYSFEYRVHYQLKGNRILITFEVANMDQNTIYFGLGGHPGFNVPLAQGLNFNDYYLEFSQAHTPVRIGMSESCFVNGQDSVFPLKNGRYLPLAHELFQHDAIIMKDVDTTVSLKTKRDNKSVTVEYPQMNYLGLWHTPNTNAPYICIEPWSSLPSRQGIIEDLEQQPGLNRLPARRVYNNTWSITIK